jgi:hypothetical protein
MFPRYFSGEITNWPRLPCYSLKFFDDVFLPILKKLVEAGLSYDEVKRLVKIPSTWGAKIGGEQFREQVVNYLPKG